MPWGSGPWGGTPWGGAPLSAPSSILGVIRLSPINLEAGDTINFPAATATLNGSVVTSPLIIDEEGFYELFVETSPALLLPIAVVDVNSLTVQVHSVGFTNDENGCYTNMVDGLTSSYGRGRKAMPNYTTEDYCADVSTNNAVVLTMRTQNDNNEISVLGKLLARTAGRHRSAEFVFPDPRTRIQAIVEIEASPFTLLAQNFGAVTNPLPPPQQSVPEDAGDYPGTFCTTPDANSISLDKNSYTAVGIVSFSDNFMAVDRLLFSGDVATHVSMSGVEDAGTFRSQPLPGVVAPLSIDHVCTVKNISSIIKAFVTPFVMHSLTREIKFGREWEISTDGRWYDAVENWTLNPFTNQLWNPTDFGSETYRFGLFRNTAGGGIQWQRQVICPSTVIVSPSYLNGGSELWSIPLGQNVEDDEFNDVTLASVWSENFTVSATPIDPKASFTGNSRRDVNSPKRSWYRIQSASDVTGQVGLHKTFINGLALPDGFYWCRLFTNYRHSNVLDNDAEIGLFLTSTASGLPDYTQEGPNLFLAEGDVGVIAPQYQMLNGGVPAGAVQMADMEEEGIHYEYIGILKEANVYTGFVASRAGNWTHLGTLTYTGGVIIDRVFVAARNSSGVTPGNMIAGVDFFRYNTSIELP